MPDPIRRAVDAIPDTVWRVLASEKRLLEHIASGDPLPRLLEELCALVDDAAADVHCTILLMDRRGPVVRHAAAPGLPAAFARAIDGRSAAPPYWGPCALAIALRSPVIIADIGEDAAWKDSAWAAMTSTFGLRSCWTTPILSRAGAALGTFALYGREPGRPSVLQQELIERFTHLASIAIERAQNEAALRQSEAFFTEAQRLSSTGSFSWNADTDEIIWSDETYRIYELDPGEPISFGRVRARIHPDDAAWFRALLLSAKADGRDLEFEHRLLMPQGHVKHLHVIARATRSKDGALEFIGAVQDVTERRRSEDALNRLRAELAYMARVSALGALTASIAHEVNQPLAGIVTNASTSLRMLAEHPPNLEGVRDAARRTMRDANRASDVIGRLRALFTRTEAVSHQLDLNDAIRDVLALSARELQSSQILLRTELATDLPPVTGDRVQLQQVALNLILNAIEAMVLVGDRARELAIRTTRDDAGHLRVSVQDNGIGLATADRARLFDPFYTTKRGGMGMGLSICRSIVERHQGELWAEPNDGPGATFTFSIPCEPASLPQQQANDPAPAS
jgi:signal transduction histidine kinase